VSDAWNEVQRMRDLLESWVESMPPGARAGFREQLDYFERKVREDQLADLVESGHLLNAPGGIVEMPSDYVPGPVSLPFGGVR
jgi:hypothetical protein